MSLTHEDLAQLKAWFEPKDHKFINGNCYLEEDPICERIESVDPAWSMTEPVIIWRDGKVTAQLGITIKGVTRYGVGQEVVRLTRDGKNEANEAEKSAATDALKRAARLFGIGRYQLSLPSEVSDVASLGRWMNNTSKSSQNGASASQSPQQAETPKAPQNDAEKPFVKDINWNKFWAYVKELNITKDDVHDAFGVDSVKDFTGTKQQATELLERKAYEINQLQRN